MGRQTIECFCWHKHLRQKSVTINFWFIQLRWSFASSFKGQDSLAHSSLTLSDYIPPPQLARQDDEFLGEKESSWKNCFEET
jgi:hypothetical protein